MALLAISVGGVAWSVAMRQWATLVWSLVATVAMARVLWTIYRPRRGEEGTGS